MAEATSGTAVPSVTPRPRGRGWVWYFVALALLGTSAITILIAYNLNQQLRPAQLEEAQRRWQERGPGDYLLRYTIKRGGEEPDRYEVEVRKGRAVAAEVNGRPVGTERLRYYGMPPLFDYVAEFLEKDLQPGQRRTFLRATFDRDDGHLTHFVRRVGGTRERVEINLRLDPVPGN